MMLNVCDTTRDTRSLVSEASVSWMGALIILDLCFRFSRQPLIQKTFQKLPSLESSETRSQSLKLFTREEADRDFLFIVWCSDQNRNTQHALKKQYKNKILNHVIHNIVFPGSMRDWALLRFFTENELVAVWTSGARFTHRVTTTSGQPLLQLWFHISKLCCDFN